MSDKYESISALMDAEATELEVRRILKGAANDYELSETWRRYHLAQTVLKGQSIHSTVDISSGVMAAIDSIESPTDSSTHASDDSQVDKRKDRWYQGAASMAVAASVTLAVLIGVQTFSNDTGISEVRQAGVIERLNANSNILPTSLAGQQAIEDEAHVIEVIRLSEDMRASINAYRSTLSAMNAPWSPSWLPQGYAETGMQVSDQGTTRLYRNGDALLTLAVQPVNESAPNAGSFSDQGVTALGRIVGDHFVSVVGTLSLSDADRVISSLSWSANPRK